VLIKLKASALGILAVGTIAFAFVSGIVPFPKIAGVENQQSANAAPNECFDGICGRVTRARFCNNNGSIQYKAEASVWGYNNTQIKSVDFKVYMKYTRGVNFLGQSIAWSSEGNWGSISNHGYRSDNYYRSWPIWIPLTTAQINTPVLISMHVWYSRPGYTNRKFDLGGIRDLGNIPVGECRDQYF
jgi:hypothetical protein